MMKKTKHVFPDHIKGKTLEWVQSVVENYELDPHHIRQLVHAAESWDLAELARAALAKDGLTFFDRFGQPRPRPEVAIARDSRILFSRILRELDLDIDPAPDSKRAPDLARYRGSPHAA